MKLAAPIAPNIPLVASRNALLIKLPAPLAPKIPLVASRNALLIKLPALLAPKIPLVASRNALLLPLACKEDCMQLEHKISKKVIEIPTCSSKLASLPHCEVPDSFAIPPPLCSLSLPPSPLPLDGAR